MFKKQQPQSLEDTIRKVRERYKNKPSPLSGLYENVGFAPSQTMPAKLSPATPRDQLLSGFRPLKDTFR